MRPGLDEATLQGKELRLAAGVSPDGRHALRSEYLAHFCSRLIKRDIPSKPLLEIVNRRSGLIQRHLGCHVDWFLALFRIGHF